MIPVPLGAAILQVERPAIELTAPDEKLMLTLTTIK